MAQAFDTIEALGAPVLSADVPSGLDADTGRALGRAVRASWTLTLLAAKPGLFTGMGRDLAGEVWLDTLGVSAPDSVASAAWLGSAERMPQPPRAHAAHKGSFGDVAVVGGAPGMAGAALLAARAAHAAGAGRVFVDLLDAATPRLDPLRPELMLRAGWSQREAAELLAGSTVVCGCGGGDGVAEVLPRLLTRAGRLLLDADALNAVAGDPALRSLLVRRAGAGRETLLTPHPLEAARLLGTTTAEVQADRLAAARRLAAELACTAVLKGSGTVIAHPDGRLQVNPTGNAALASAGTGDVLAGWIGGWWAQLGDAWIAATEGVRAHGAAADRSGRAVMRAGDLVEALSAAR